MRNFKEDFLSGSEYLQAFYPHLPGVPDVPKLTEAKSKSALNRKLLVQVLQKQYGVLPEIAEVQNAIESLQKDNCFTLTTGHQLCLGTGPMYVILKTVSIIRQAEIWNTKYPDMKFIPIFWMASEDHDAPEVNHCFPNPFDKAEYKGNFQGPVGRHIIDISIQEVLLNDNLKWLVPYYTPGETWAMAFKKLMHSLFGKYGLVLLDGDDADLKNAFWPVMKEELLKSTSHKLLSNTTQNYSELYPVQAHVREVNLFWFKDQQRIPLKPLDTKGNFKIPDGSEHTLPGDESPENFSPSALLRPLYQEWILPNIVYCGGWAELNYWMQLGELFQAYSIPFPALMPRYSATLYKPDVIEHIQDIHQSPEQAEMKIFESLWPLGPWQERTREVLEAYSKLRELAAPVDDSLVRSLSSAQHKMDTFLSSVFPKKIKKQLRNRYAEKFKAIDNWRTWKEPFGKPQERILNISAFGLPPEILIERLYKDSSLQAGKEVIVVM